MIVGREYFLLGHEDVARQRLLYTHLSVGLEWRKKYAKEIGVRQVMQSLSHMWFFKLYLFGLHISRQKWEKAKKQTSNTRGN